MDGSCDQLFPSSRLPVDKNRRVGGGNLFNLSERGQEHGAIANDLLEVVLAADFLLQVNVLFLQLGLEAANFLVGLHILNRQYDLVRHFLQEHGVLIRIPIHFPAYQAERTDTFSMENERQAAHRLDALCYKAALIGILPLLFKIATQQRSPMVEHPTGAGLVAAILQPRSEIVREQVSLHGEEAESISLRLIYGNGATIEGDNAMQGVGNRVQERRLVEVRDDRVVNLKERASTLLTSSQRRFRALALRDVLRKRHHKLRHALRARNQRNIIVYPNQAAVSSSILLLDLELFPFSF